MEDREIARILADEFNKFSREEEVNRDDEDCLELLRDRKLSICKVMDLLGVNHFVGFDHKVIARLKSGIDAPLESEGCWRQRIEQVAKALVERYNNAVETLDAGDLSDGEVFDMEIVKREAARYLRLLHLGAIKPDGTAVVSIERMPLGD